MTKLSRDELIKLIKEVMRNANRTIVCEKQLQFDLAWELKKSTGAKIHLEYATKPKQQEEDEEENNSKKTRYYYDIVIEDDVELIPIELKFKTKSVKGHEEYTNQAAQDLARYDFWRDVKRIEDFNAPSEKFASVGYAVMVTNDGAYVDKSGENTMYKSFSVNKDREVKAGKLDWASEPSPKSVGENRMNGIEIKNDYKLNWEEDVVANNGVRFNVLVLEVKKA